MLPANYITAPVSCGKINAYRFFPKTIIGDLTMSRLMAITRFFIYASIFLIPFYFLRFHLAGIPTNPLEISIFIAFLSHLIDHVVAKREIRILAFDWSIILFVFFALMAVVISPDKIAALGILKGWFIAPVLPYFTARESFSKKEAYKLAIPLFVSGVFVTAWAIVQKFGIISTLFYQRGDANFDQYLSGNVRLFGPFESPNYLAMFIVPVFFLSWSLLPKIKNYGLKIIFIILNFLPLYVLYYSKSRGGLLALAAGLIIYLFAYSINRFSLNRSANLKGIAAIVMALFAFFVYRFGFNPDRDFSRLQIYKYDWSLIKSYFVTGIGFGNFQNLVDKLSAGNDLFRTEVLSYAIHPHNLYIAVWLYLGLGGLIFFILLISQFYSRAFGRLNEKMVIFPISAMTAILAHGLVDSTYFKNDLSALFFLIVAFLLIAAPNEKTHR